MTDDIIMVIIVFVEIVSVPCFNPSKERLTMSLNAKELDQLEDLLSRMDNTQMRGRVWKAYVKKCITPAVEACIVDDKGDVFLAHRKDDEFEGYTFPGTVINDWENLAKARIRLMTNPNNEIALSSMTPLKPIGYIEAPRGNGPEDNPTRNTLSLLHVARYKGVFPRQKDAGFYKFGDLPSDTLGTHRFLLRYFERYMRTGQPILGE